MRRFYEHVAVAACGKGFATLLDGRPLRTPGGRALGVPAAALAAAVADEWRGQRETVRLAAMPLTRLAFAAHDRPAAESRAAVDTVAGHAETDLLCYRAAEPPSLVERQEALWRPVIDWAAERYAVRFAVTSGVMPVPQPAASLAAVRAAVAAADAWVLTGLRELTLATGSVLLGLACAEGRLSAAGVVAASQVDERFQAERWGEDEEAAARRAALAADIEAAARFLRLLAR